MWWSVQGFDYMVNVLKFFTNETLKDMYGETVQAKDNPGGHTVLRTLITWSIHWVTVGNVISQEM